MYICIEDPIECSGQISKRDITGTYMEVQNANTIEGFIKVGQADTTCVVMETVVTLATGPVIWTRISNLRQKVL